MKQTEELINQLRHTLTKMELALGIIDEAIIWTDITGAIEWCNGTFDRLIGRSHIEILSGTISEFLPLKKHDAAISWEAQLKLALTEDGIKEIYEYSQGGKNLSLEMCAKYLVLDNKMTIIIVLREVKL